MAQADLYLTEARAPATGNACGSNAQDLLYRFEFDGNASGIVRCPGWGLAYSSPRPAPHALGDFCGDGYHCVAQPELPDPSAALSFKERFGRTILSRDLGYAHLAGTHVGVVSLITRFLAKFLVLPTHRLRVDRTTLTRLIAGAGFTDAEVRSLFHGSSVDTARAVKLRLVAEMLLKIYALAVAFTGNGKPLTLIARKAA